ncbi:CehA/McbA family metallohydrolase [Planctomonas sp. JC2975]|uniref:CehA/McbA family metallohydrolase n=1 Tax=Planctomonas sp. JC2975 TaxID=2729626 RepID=UPI00147544FC|nr:CehA/McbA family metallohydrolase [Planctomonas sp. JC2975]NNC12018.1 CehA/McbA family metallohydrolase [Planctomonas sp. JC2975]
MNVQDAAPPAPARGLSRRALLAALGTGAGIALAPMVFADPADAATAATPSGPQTKTISGHLDAGAPDFVYLPVVVPAGITQIAVSYSYSKPSVPSGTPGNSCDIGMFDARGMDVGGAGFRGWSGGFRTEFAISKSEATPGYLPGNVMPGTWHVVLGPYQVTPQGMDYEVQVTLTAGAPGSAFAPAYPATSAKGRGRAWYRGDCHLHTVYSDGRNTPDNVAAGARARGLDFMVSTDHNTTASHGVWGPLAGDDLLIITGEEVTTRNGHWLAIGTMPGDFIDWRYRARDNVFPAFQRRVGADGGLNVSAHMYCPWIGAEWKFGWDGLDGTEVWTGPWGWDDDAAVSTWANLLAQAARTGKKWLPAFGNSDAHNPTDVIGLPHNVVLADDLSRQAILAGLKAGRSWIAESADVQLAFSATSAKGRTAGIGDILQADDSEDVTVTVEASGVPNGTVRLFTDEGQMLQTRLPASGEGTVTWVTRPEIAAFVRAEVRHPMADGSAGGTSMGPSLSFGPMAALTNPIWLRGH